MKFLRISRCRGLSPAGRFLRGEEPLKLPKHLLANRSGGLFLFYFSFMLALRARFFMPRFFKARYWWETFVETKVLPPSPLSKEL